MPAVTNLSPLSNCKTAESISASNKSAVAGRVVLVGAGPGDPDLLTVKALRVIQAADIILYDRLVSEDIRSLFPASTPALYVGKAKDQHSISQSDLNQLLVEKAKAGLTVCRLKGGDAFMFGRGGEEMLVLKQAGIEMEVVPGITAGVGCSSYAGIPLTHRGIAQGCTFVTGHADKSLDLNWASLARLKHTLVFYMGLSSAATIQRELLTEGLAASTPVALVENGCCENQRVVRGNLEQLAALVVEENVQSPALIVIGDVVNLADDLAWFAQASLTDKSVNRSLEKFAAVMPVENLDRLSA